MSKKKVIITVCVLVVLGIIGFLVYRNVSSIKKADVGVPTPVEKIGRDTIVTKVTAKGTVTLNNPEQIYPNTEAEVSEVLVKVNDYVTLGQPLLTYNTKTLDDLNNQLASLKLDLRNAELTITGAQISNKDAQKIPESQILSSNYQIEQAQKAVNSAEFAQSQHEQAITQLEKKLADAQQTYDKTKLLVDSGVSAKAELDAAQKTIDDLKAQYDTEIRNRQSYAADIQKANDALANSQQSKAILGNDYDPAQAQNNIAQAQVTADKLRLQISQVQKKIDEFSSELLSPFEGTITAVNISKGEIAPTSKAIFSIADLNDYVLTVNIKERSAPSIQLGQAVAITGDALGKDTIQGTVTEIAPIAQTQQSGTTADQIVPVKVKVDPNAPALRPGYSMDATIVTRTAENVVVVPILATMNDKDSKPYVFVVKEDNTLEKRYIELGAFSDQVVEATGIDEGETIVSQPTQQTAEGMLIMPITSDVSSTSQPAEEGGAQ